MLCSVIAVIMIDDLLEQLATLTISSSSPTLPTGGGEEEGGGEVEITLDLLSKFGGGLRESNGMIIEKHALNLKRDLSKLALMRAAQSGGGEGGGQGNAESVVWEGLRNSIIQLKQQYMLLNPLNMGRYAHAALTDILLEIFSGLRDYLGSAYRRHEGKQEWPVVGRILGNLDVLLGQTFTNLSCVGVMLDRESELIKDALEEITLHSAQLSQGSPGEEEHYEEVIRPENSQELLRLWTNHVKLMTLMLKKLRLRFGLVGQDEWLDRLGDRIRGTHELVDEVSMWCFGLYGHLDREAFKEALDALTLWWEMLIKLAQEQIGVEVKHVDWMKGAEKQSQEIIQQLKML